MSGEISLESMKLLIKSATLVDNTSDLNFKVKDILIEDGVITEISDKIESKADKIIKYKNLHVSEGWLDTSVSFGEPGYEERENIENGLLTAASSGFTSVLLNPNTKPLTDSHSSVSHIIKKSINPNLKVEGILLTMYDNRTLLTSQVENQVKHYFSEFLMKTIIPRNIRLSEAPSHGKPIVLYANRSRGSDSYVELAQEVIKRTKGEMISPRTEPQEIAYEEWIKENQLRDFLKK